jgi:hypothetical protein
LQHSCDLDRIGPLVPTDVFALGIIAHTTRPHTKKITFLLDLPVVRVHLDMGGIEVVDPHCLIRVEPVSIEELGSGTVVRHSLPNHSNVNGPSVGVLIARGITRQNREGAAVRSRASGSHICHLVMFPRAVGDPALKRAGLHLVAVLVVRVPLALRTLDRFPLQSVQAEEPHLPSINI